MKKVPLEGALQWVPVKRYQHHVAGWPERPKPTKAELEEFRAMRLAQIAERRKKEVPHG